VAPSTRGWPPCGTHAVADRRAEHAEPTVYGHLMQDLEIFDFDGRQEASSVEQLV
jgi:hypothetical protein